MTNLTPGDGVELTDATDAALGTYDGTDSLMNARLAEALANAVADNNEAKRSIDKKIAQAKVEGMCTTAYILGIGNTPFHVEITAVQAQLDDPRPPFTTFNEGRKEWVTRQVAHLMAAGL